MTLRNPRSCKLKPPFEVMLSAIVAGLLAEGRVPNGSIVDAGAQYGRWSCYYAATAPDRTVRAVEPNPEYVDHMRTKYTQRKLPNLQPFHGGLSNESAQYQQGGGGGLHVYTHAKSFPIFTLDQLFSAGGAWAGDALGFAHLDVEGLEERVVAGAMSTIARDQPLLSVELTVHKHPERTRSLLRLIDSLGYDALVVQEIAGVRCDIVNALCLPRSRRRLLANSNVLDLGVASRALVAVDADTVNRTAFPCCVAGGACCPNPLDQMCCSHGLVQAWMNGVARAGGADLRLAARTRWYDQKYEGWRPELTPRYHREQLLADLARAGFAEPPTPGLLIGGRAARRPGGGKGGGGKGGGKRRGERAARRQGT